jgi:hypothetical protein
VAAVKLGLSSTGSEYLFEIGKFFADVPETKPYVGMAWTYLRDQRTSAIAQQNALKNIMIVCPIESADYQSNIKYGWKSNRFKTDLKNTHCFVIHYLRILHSLFFQATDNVYAKWINQVLSI